MSKWNLLYLEVDLVGYQYLRNCAQSLINLEVLAPFLRHIIFSCFPSLVLGSYWGKTPNRPDPYTTILGNKRIDGKGDKRIIPLINRCAACGWKDRSFSNDSALMGRGKNRYNQYVTSRQRNKHSFGSGIKWWVSRSGIWTDLGRPTLSP